MTTPENDSSVVSARGTRRIAHVGLPIACAGTIEVGNVIHVDRQSFIVTKVGGAAFDMTPVCGTCHDTGMVRGWNYCPECRLVPRPEFVAGERSAALLREYEFLDEFGNVWRQTLEGPKLARWRES